MPDAHVPPFAKVPFQPLSRAAVVAIAFREWRLFGQGMADPEAKTNRTAKPEREEGSVAAGGRILVARVERRVAGKSVDWQA